MWDQLKNIIRETSDKAVIIEDGEPRFVVLTVKEYNRLHDIVEGKINTNSDVPEERKEMNTSNQASVEEPNDNVQQSQDYEKVNEELSLEIDETARQQAEKMLRPELNTESSNETSLI